MPSDRNQREVDPRIYIMRAARSVAFAALLLWSAVVTVTYILGTAVLFFLLPGFTLVYRVIVTLTKWIWFSFASGLLEFLVGIRFPVHCGASSEKVRSIVSTKRAILVICNHRTRLDWMFLWVLFGRLRLLSQLTIVLKFGMKNIPFVGWAMQCFHFIFLSRSSAKWNEDKPYLVGALRRITQRERACILIFPEGTDLSNENIEKSNAFGLRHNLSLSKKYTLHPRVKGFEEILRSTKEIDCVLDVTMAFDDARGERPSEKSIIRGTLPHAVHFLCKCYTPSDIKGTGDVAKWLRGVFDDKERALCRFYETGTLGRAYKIDKILSQTRLLPFVTSSIVLLIITSLVVYGIFSIGAWFWMFTSMLIVPFLLLQTVGGVDGFDYEYRP